ncbi:MAG: hypothetical protein MI717_12330 [Spirochaetales bacterium]|nr:hypothetical protein [Spirochaetales bacterium]
MSKKLLAIFLLFTLLLPSVFAVESGESWARLYKRLDDIDQKHAVLQNIVSLDDRSLESFLSSSLDDLVYGNLSYFRENRATYDSWEALVRTLVKELGDIKAQSASSTIMDIVETTDSSLLKAEAMVALGRMRALEYAPDIALILRNLNFNTRGDLASAEIEAYGAVVALERLRDDVGFEPLFYATVGWYRDRVTTDAERALLSFDDVASRLNTILLSASDYREKRQCLELALRSDASAEQKAQIITTSLQEGLRYAESDATRARRLAELRLAAMKGMVDTKLTTEALPALLKEVLEERSSDEALLAILALGADGGDEAVEILSQRIRYYNDRQASGLGLTFEEDSTLRQLIFALGEAGNEKGLMALKEMTYFNYTPGITRQAREAVKRISGE